MFVKQVYSSDLEANYKLLLEQLTHLLEGEFDLIANLANASALLNHFLSDINWVGFYLKREYELVLGPFQGLPACNRIQFNKGVCGISAATKKTFIVKDVHQFHGHIACDALTKSEIVIPLLDKSHQLIGVLDIDSPTLDRFTKTDQQYLEKFIEILSNNL